MCVYSPLGLVIFVAVERTFVCFTKSHEHFISNSIRCGCLRTDQMQYRMHWQLTAAPPARRRRSVPCDLRRASLPVPPLLGCGIHSLQWSTIPRIGRHSAGYNVQQLVSPTGNIPVSDWLWSPARDYDALQWPNAAVVMVRVKVHLKCNCRAIATYY